ncbi:MAG: metal ABC transporter permease [Pseudomonadota bacterium]
MSSFVEALLLQAGYNAALVAIGALLLGIAAGVTGTFLFLRKRALVSDAVAHATLPGIALAFIAVVMLGGDGRNLIVLMMGAATTAVAGLVIVEWITRRTRLAEDAAIGAVLSVFFGFGVVLLTVIQTLSAGRQAGLESFLLGSTAGMLFQDAVVIVIGGGIAVACVVLLQRPMTLVSFDPEYAQSYGVSVRSLDLIMMGLVTAVTVIGLKIVGLILIVAMLIIPAVAARFWTDRTDRVVTMAGVIGGASGYVGSALSASAPSMPTGPIVVLVCFALFVISLIFAPNRGLLASGVRQRRFQLRVHRRQGLLAIARDEVIFDRLTLAVLKRAGFIRRDGVPTDVGRAQAAKALRDERRWDIVRQIHKDDAVAGQYDGLTSIESILTRDEIAEIDREIGPSAEVTK